MCWPSLISAVNRPAERAQTSEQYGFTAVAVTVAEAVEGWSVARFGQMGEFVADDVVAEFRIKKDAEV